MAGPRNSIESSEPIIPDQQWVSPFDGLPEEDLGRFLPGMGSLINKCREGRKDRIEEMRQEIGLTVQNNGSGDLPTVNNDSSDS